MRYIVTGATSCIGNAVCQYLLDKGDTVMAVIRKGSVKEESFCKQFTDFNNLKIVHADFSEPYNIKNHIDKADIYINFAWAGTSKEQRNSPEIQNANAKYSLESIQVASELGCKVYVEAGSQAEYGWQNGELTTEESPCEPFSEYGKAKLKTWLEGKELARELGLSYVHLRIFSVYGEGELPNTLISTCINKMSKNETVELSPCTQLWNYLYRDDAAEMICKLAEHHYNNVPAQEIYNIASLDTRPLRNFVEEIKFYTRYCGNAQYGVLPQEKLLYLNPSIDKMLNIISKNAFIPFCKGITLKTRRLMGGGKYLMCDRLAA